MKKNIDFFYFSLKKGNFPFSKSIFLVGILFLLLFSCKSDPKTGNKREIVKPDPSFAPFYKRFHEDSVYQMAHINFPLQGLPQKMDSTNLASQDFFWDKESWTIQHDFDEAETGFTKHINAVTPEMIEERIVDKTGEFEVVRRFVKLNGEWYLIYFSGLHRIGG
ncbi:MAG TPA: hypothetical protein ENK85_09380 [Saprospiraceae bacterium]|nr:hypothetical protein [Saprospiraceae bacterium]